MYNIIIYMLVGNFLANLNMDGPLTFMSWSVLIAAKLYQSTLNIVSTVVHNYGQCR